MRTLIPYYALLCSLFVPVSLMADDAIPFKFDPITSADAARLVRVSTDGDVMAVIGVGIQDTPGNLRTYTREPGTTNWTERGLLPAPGNALSVDVDSCGMAVGLAGTVTVWSITCNASKPIWFKDATISFTNNNYAAVQVDLDGDRLAVMVAKSSAFGYDRTIEIYDRVSLSNWAFRAEISNVATTGIIGAGSIIDSMDLDGDKIAVGSSLLSDIYIHQKDNGGVNAWGRAKTLPDEPAGLYRRGMSVALNGTRLAAVALSDATDRPHVLVYSNHTGGAGNWGYAGSLLAEPADTGIISLDTDNGRLAVLGGPAVNNFLDTGKRGQFWVYGPGIGAGGWALEKTQKTVPFNWSLFEFFYSGGIPSISISSNDFVMGLGDTNNFEDITGWAASMHNRNTGGANQWGLQRLFETVGNPGDFGQFLHMDGKFLVVGMPGDDWNGADTGSAYVWYHNDVGGQSTWFPVARLAKNSGVAGDRFGEGVAIYETDAGNKARVAVGAPGEFTDNGAVYIYEVSIYQGQTKPETRIIPFPYSANSQFGYSVAINDKTLAVGAPLNDTVSGDAGAVYMYKDSVTNGWLAIQTNFPPAGTFSFGSYMDMTSSKLAVTMYTVADGRVAVYDKNTGGTENWGLLQTILPPTNTAGGFPAALDIISSGSAILIGDTAGGGTNIGKAHVYATFTSTTYEVFFTIEGSVADGTSFGWSVAWLSFTGVAIGAPFTGGGITKVYSLSLLGGLTNISLLATSVGNAGDQLGYTLTGSAFYLAAGAPKNDDNGSNAGRVETMRVGAYEIWAGSQPPAFTNAWRPWENWDGDPDDNLMEFAMGTDPMNGSSNQKLIMYVDRGSDTNMAWRRPDLAYSTYGLDYNMQSSDNLDYWGHVADSSHPTNSSIRLFDVDDVKQHYRLAPRYPVFSTSGGDGVIIIVAD